MLTTWSGQVPVRQEAKRPTALPEHLQVRRTVIVSFDPVSKCPHCQGALERLGPPIIVQTSGYTFSTHANQARHCTACPIVILDGERLLDTLGLKDRPTPESFQLVGIMVGSQDPSDSTIYPFDEVVLSPRAA